MEARAYLKHVRISPRKVQIVCDLIRGKSAAESVGILMHKNKSSSEPVLKLLKSAMANAENNHAMNPEKLYVAQIFATEGPMMKRIRPRAQGRAFRVIKRTSHVSIVLKEKE